MKFVRFWLESLGVGILAACLTPLDLYQKTTANTWKDITINTQDFDQVNNNWNHIRQ